MRTTAFHLFCLKWLSLVQKCPISLLQEVSNVKELQLGHGILTKLGLSNYPHVIFKLIHFAALSPYGSLEYARSLFDSGTTDDRSIYNTMIRAYAQSDFPEEAIHLYNLMQNKSIKSDHFTYPFVLKSCAKICEAEEDRKALFVKKGSELHSRMIRSGLISDHFIQNSLMNFYSHCGRVDLTRQVFDNMTGRSITSWNIMTLAYYRCNDPISAESLLAMIPEKNVVFYNNMITQHVKSRNINAAWRIFTCMPDRDSISWNSILSGVIQTRDYKTAINLFQQMQISRISPTEITLVSVLGACAEIGALETGVHIHKFMLERNFKVEGVLGTALVDMYGKCGNLTMAHQIFDGMGLKHVSCWNSMIMSLAVHGYCEQALNVFESMQKKESRVLPNSVTFIAILIACSHKGLVNEGCHFFSQMVTKYNIWPTMKHYGCMVDLLSRWGLLNDAYEMIKSMPFPANGILWRTILGACRVHKNVELAEEAINKLSELEALSDGDYVLLSNIYAEAGRWNIVEDVRKSMKKAGVSKKFACSQA